MLVRIGLVAAYLAVFGCNGVYESTVGFVRSVGAIGRVISEANRPAREQRRMERDHYRAIHSRYPDYDAELDPQPARPDGYGDLPAGDWRTERGGVLDAPAPDDALGSPR